MALVKFGGGVIQMTGSIAGTTFAKNRYGNYGRARTKPVNPNTDRQVTIRTAMAFLTDRWAQTLTDAQRIAWNLYGSNVAMKNRLGEVINLSGFNHYLRSNIARQADGITIIDAGPVIFELPAHDPLFAVAISEATQQITTTYSVDMDWSTEDGAHMFCYQGMPQNPQRNFFAGPWRRYQVIAGVDPGPPVSPAVNAVQFAVAEGQREWAYGRISRADGRISTPFQSDVIVSA